MTPPKACVPHARGRGSDLAFWLLAPLLIPAVLLGWVASLLTLRPRVTVTVADATPAPSRPTNTGVAFVVGFADDGDYNTAVKVTSFEQFQDTFGARVAHSVLYDWVATAFRYGAHTIWVSRVGGPAATPEDDDNANATDVEWLAALNAFAATLGPGQVAGAGRTTSAGHAQLIAHGAARNRRAVLDAPDASTAAQIATLAGTDGAVADSWVAAGFSPWLDAVDIDLPSSTRAVPLSAAVCGLIARTDALEGLGQPPAGRGGIGMPGQQGRGGLRDSLRDTFTDAEWDTIAGANWNLAVDDFSGPVLMGFDSVTTDDDYRQFTGARIFMGLVAELEADTAAFQFTRIDGKGTSLAAWGGALTSRCDTYYRRGDLYGATSAEAFDVDTSPAVNPPETLATGVASAVVRARPSPFARDLDVTLQRHRIDQPLTAA